jgi:uroporphyrinogen decarboxylase
VPLAEVTIDEEAKEAFLGTALSDLETDIEFYIRAGYDYITLGRRIAGFPPIWDAAEWKNYYRVQRQVGHAGSAGVIGNWADFKNYPWMRPENLDFRILDEATQLLPREMKVVRYMGPVFQMAWMLMGFNAFSYMLADDPSLVEAILDKIYAIVLRELEDALDREVVGAVWYCDDIAVKDGVMVSPALLNKYFFPKLKELAGRCRERGIPFIYHTDGNISEVLDEIQAAGVDAIHPIDPTGMNIYDVKQRLAGKLCVIGNIDVDLLLRGTPEEVEADVEKHLHLLGPGGGYVLGSSNSIPRACKSENYRTMLETTRRSGAYPIRVA